MTDRRDPSDNPVVAFVVVTRVKPDGRKIHYYEWPARQPEAAKAQRSKAATMDRRRV